MIFLEFAIKMDILGKSVQIWTKVPKVSKF